MGSCDDMVEVHEPSIRASVGGHSCLEVEPKVLPCSENGRDLVDSGTVLADAQNQCSELSRNYDAISLSGDGVGTAVGGMPVEAAAESGSGDRLVSRKLLGDECGVSGDCLNIGNADCVCSSDGVETELVNRLTELAGESENVVCLVSGKLLADECGDSRDCSNEEQGKNLDSSVENDGSCVDKQGFTGESNGLVVSLESSESSSQLSFVSDSLRKDCQKNDNEDEKSIVVHEVMEEKSNYSAGIGTADDEKTAPLVGSEMHPKLKDVSCSLTFSAKQDEQNCVAPLESVIKERGADLDGLEANNPVVPSDSVPEDKQEDDQIKTIVKSSPEGVLEFVNEAAHVLKGIEAAHNQVVSSLAPENFLELRPVVGSPEKVVDEDVEKDNSPVSAPRDEVVMEMPDDVSSMIETVSSHNISASPIINMHLQSFTQQNELDMQSISGSAFETDLEQRSDNSVRSEVNMCTQTSQHGGEIPTESMQTVCQIIGPGENDIKNGKGFNFVTVETTPEEIEESSAAKGYVQALPLLDSQSTFENTTFDDSVNNVLQQNEQCNDKHFDCSSTKSLSGVAEEKSDIKTDIKVEIIGCEDRNAKNHKEGSDEMPPSSFANKTFSPESCQTLIVDENGSSKSSYPLGKGIKHSISFSNTVDCPGQTDIRVEDEDRIYCDSETKCDYLIPTSSQRSSQTTKIIWKPQTKRAARKCSKEPTAANLNEIVETILKAPRSKRNLNSNPARSNIWGSLYTNFFEQDNELKLNHVQNNGLQKSKIGRGNRKRTSSRVGGSSRRKSRENRSSTSCIRLKVKVGKEICQNSLDGMVPEVIDSSASTDAANATSGSKDKIGEKSGKMQLKCHDNKPGVVDTCSDASLLNLHQANRGLEGTLTSESPAGDAAEHYLGVSDHVEADRLEAVIEKRYTDPGTSPDSEVINAISEGQAGAACEEDFAEAILISKTGVTAPNVTTGKKGKKDRNPCSDNCFKKDRSSGGANKSKTKPRKKCQDGQRKDESVCSSEILTSSTSVIALPRVTEYGVPKEALMVDMNTEIKTHSDLDVDLDLAGSQNLKNGPPLTKSKVRQKKSDREGKRTSKVHDPDRSKKKNGCRQRGNERKVVNKKNAKEKTISNQVNKIDDDSDRGNHAIDKNGKTDAADNAITMSMGMANLDLASSHVLDENLPAESAWVHCDVCHKWRRIPVSLVDSIGQTNCQWICKDNMDKAFADCSIPQEKSNAEINAELGISDVDEDAYDVPLNIKGLDSMRDGGSKEYEFTRISTNQFLHRSRKTQTIDEIMVCHCRPPLNGGLGCGDECLNRMLNIECVRGTCPCGDLCSNQQFQKRSYAKMRWNRCGKKGFGLRSEDDISKGQFLIEYVGEVLDMHTYEARQKEYASKGHKHFYFMTLDGSEVIDACAKGNLGRFINHSCDPNCRTEKWVVNGEICIGLFALRDIKKSEEVTFDYNYVRVFGAAAKKCYCGASQCRGYIGGDPSNTEVIDQVDSDEEFPEPVMIEEVQGRNGHQNKLPRRSSSDGVEMQIAENILKNRDKMDNYRKPVGKLEVMNQSAASTCLLDSSVEISDIKTGVPSSSEAVKTVDDSSKTTSSVQQDISVEETAEKSSSSAQGLEASPNVNSKASSDGITNKKSKSGASEEKRIFVKSRFLIKTSRQPVSVKKENSTVSSLNVNKSQISANKSQVVLVKSKKLMEGASNGRFEAVEEKLNELLDSDGGISKRKDAPKGYLKLLLHTAASGANKNGEAIQSNRDLSMILDALLKTKSRVVLVDIIEKNGLRMLHNMLKVYRRDFKKTPILRKLLKVLEYLANRQILTSEHIHGDAPCPGMESFRESMLSLTEHDDKQVHQIARSFRDRWFPRNIRKFSHMDRDDRRMEFNSGSNGNRASASHNYLCDQGAKPAVTVDSVMQSRVGTTLDTAVQEVSSAPSSASGSTRTRKRKSRWDQPAEEKPVSLQHSEQKVGSTLPQQSESNVFCDTVNKEDVSCPHCYLNYCLQKEACRVEDGSQNILEDAPPGFSSPRNGILASSSTSSTVADIRQQDNCSLDGVIGHPRSKFNSHLPVSYGIPMPIVQQFGSFDSENESWIIAPGMPFHPFPPLPPFPQKRKETLPCTATQMSIDENAGQQQDSCVPANFHASENCPSTTRSNKPDMHFPESNNQQLLKRPREFSNDLGRRYFRQQKCNLPPWIRKRNGWDT